MMWRTFLLIATVIAAGCQPQPKKHQINTTRAFYYWKSVYRNEPAEQAALRELNAELLYIKFFDVDWNYASRRPFPLAQIRFTDKPDSALGVIPVVFITNRALIEIDSSQVHALAENISSLLHGIATSNEIGSIHEVQIDCDWTERTRDKYFHLLRLLRKGEFLRGKSLSATIRLHQVKFKSRSGVPPVDRGLLMAYNIGNIKDPKARNSIIDSKELAQYIADLGTYPLPLDLGLPLFSWYVWFDSSGSYKGLIHDYRLPAHPGESGGRKASNYRFPQDEEIAGFHFKKGDLLRKEESEAAEILAAGRLFAEKYRGDSARLACFHLDSIILRKYPIDALEEIFDCLRR